MVVVNAYWSQLEPVAYGPIVRNNAIDQLVAQVRSINSERKLHPLEIKIRLFAGIYAPEWVKKLGGGPVSVTDPTTGLSGTIGRFWTPSFGSAYAQLQQKLAAKYDDVVEIHEVTMARCTTIFDEPFIRDLSSQTTVNALLASGFTTKEDLDCLQAEVKAQEAWHHTMSGLALNPYQRIGDGTPRIDESITYQMMQYCRQRLGRRCVLENNSLRFPPLDGPYTTMYAQMKRFGPPISFQTASARRVGDLARTVQLAADLGAQVVELPTSSESLNLDYLEQLSSYLVHRRQ